MNNHIISNILSYGFLFFLCVDLLSCAYPIAPTTGVSGSNLNFIDKLLNKNMQYGSFHESILIDEINKYFLNKKITNFKKEIEENGATCKCDENSCLCVYPFIWQITLNDRYSSCAQGYYSKIKNNCYYKKTLLFSINTRNCNSIYQAKINHINN